MPDTTNSKINLYRSFRSECHYLPNRISQTEFFISDSFPGVLYENLLEKGFRRSGNIFYRNVCPGCEECVPIRIPVSLFMPSRSQMRAVRKNRDVSVTMTAAEFRLDVFELYQRYTAFKHGDNDGDEKSFRGFLCESPLDSLISLYRVEDTLAAAGWIDVLPNGLSSVYFAFDPDFARRSLGVFSVLKEIEITKNMGLQYYYLGFVVNGSQKMGYKAAYRPHQRLRNGIWTDEA
jgi:arginine-tRNA-protein transferase